MKIFQNKNIWQKIVIILLIILLFKFVINTPIVHADNDDVLLEPITSLFANLGDGIMDIAQRTFLGMESSGAWVEDSSNTWLKVLTIAAGLLIATLAVAATIVSGGSALVVVASIVGAVVKIGAATAIAYFTVSTMHFGSHGFYLPEYELTLESIFKNEVLAFDVNFFNPKEPEEKDRTTGKKIDISSLGKEYKDNTLKVVARELNQSQYNDFKEKYNVGGTFANYSNEHKGSKMHEGDKFIISGNVASGASDSVIMHKYTWSSNNKTYTAYYGYKSSLGDYYYISDLRETTAGDDVEYSYSPADILQPTVSSWYLTLRNIALVALLSILVYIGIRITLTSVAGDKAKYKQMLADWVIAIVLVFLMHYIMSFAVSINELIIQGISSITLKGYGSESDVVGNADKKVGSVDFSEPLTTQEADYVKDEYKGVQSTEAAKEFQAAGVQFFILDDKDKVTKAYKALVDDGDSSNSSDNKGSNSSFYNRFNEDKTVMVWPANDFMVQARILGQDIGEDETQSKVARAGYNIIYIVLVLYTIMFCFTYLKRVIYMAFLTLIAPMVAITYPIDKISDGKAQAFDMWIKEYIFNLLMQPMHLILYTILVGMAMKFAANNIFYAVVAIGFLVPAEKILRRFFRFDRAQTPGIFEGAAGAALLMQGLNKIMHRPQHRSKLGSGGEGQGEEDKGKITTYKGEDPYKGLNAENEEEGSNVKTVNEGKEEGGKEKESDYTVQTAGDMGADFTGGTTSSTNIDATKESKDKKEINDKAKDNKNRNDIKFPRARRAIRRGLITHGEGIRRRYTANKKLKGGLARRAIRTAGGIATAGTMAAAGGIIGITTGDMKKAAQYMGAGAIGGYSLGKAGVDKTADKLKEQYGEPLKQAKIGYYGEEEYAKREHEKWKKQEFEQNSRNIQKVQDKYNLSWKDAKEKSNDIKEYADVRGIDSFDKAMAAYMTSVEGGGSYSKAEAKVLGNLVNGGKLNGKGADSLDRDERKQFTKDLVDRLEKNGYNKKDARKQASRLIEGTNEYAKNLK